ncbi:MAG: hypothetical protein OQL20_13425 [Sedimenticola sp.]|nr:hypothetical protein [Sedimenticola sp.]
MNKAKNSVHLVVPGLLGPMPALMQSEGEMRLPRLEQVLARSQPSPFPGKSLEPVVFRLFGVRVDEGRNLPTAAYRRIGDGASVDERYWLQANPVYLRPDQDRLLLFDTEDLALTRQEASELAALFNTHFSEEGWQVEVANPQRWYLPLDRAPDLVTHELTDAFGRNMDLFLPGGGEGFKWHGVLNEIQMLFYTSAVNEQRESAGKGAISGLWLSGGGRLTDQMAPTFTALFSNDPLLKGLAATTSLGIHEPPQQIDQLSAVKGEVLLHYDALQRPVLCADPMTWKEEMLRFEAWLSPLIDALKKGQLDEIRLYPCDGQQYRIDRSALRRFWRRRKPIVAHLDTNQ